MARPRGRAPLPELTHLWYAAYGSNTDATRFSAYLARCSAPVEPLDSRPVVLDLPLTFAGATTSRWGPGGVAFAGPHREAPPRTLARAWLLPAATLAEIGALENRLPLERAALDIRRLAGGEPALTFPGRWYDTWLPCGELDGALLVTLSWSRPHLAANPPGPAYTAVVGRGLQATFDLSDTEVASYLAPRAGLAPETVLHWLREERGTSVPNV